MRRLLALVAVLALVAATGCAGRDRVTDPTPGAPDAVDTHAFDRRAAEVIAAWRQSGVADAWRHGFVPLADLTVLGPSPGFSADTKTAFSYGWYTLAATLPTATPAAGRVRYPDGTANMVPLVSAAEAYRQIDRHDPRCPATCVPLKVTSARLGAVELRTSRGTASVPAWLFTVAGMGGPIARVAVAPTAISPVPTPAATRPAIRGLVTAQDIVTVDGPTVQFRLGVGSCDVDITPLVYETADVVAVAGSVRTAAGACDAMLRLQPVTVKLAAPLGDRVLLDGINGQPLAVGE